MDITQFKKTYEHKKVEENNNKVAENSLVTVCIQTYQHVDYIKECLDGILNQKTNFDFEILLGEDASTDGTREICIDYAEKYPDKIRLFLHHRENNIKIGGQPTGRFNFLYNLYTAQGKYIALCEGDDYWTDPLKLQKQVDFLEENKNVSLTFHDTVIIDHKGNEIRRHQLNKGKTKFQTRDIIADWFIHTQTIVFRKSVLELVSEKTFFGLINGDWILQLLCSLKGDIAYLPELSYASAYRKHPTSVSTMVGKDRTLRTMKLIELFDRFNMLSDFQYNKEVEAKKTELLEAYRNQYYTSLKKYIFYLTHPNKLLVRVLKKLKRKLQ